MDEHPLLQRKAGDVGCDSALYHTCAGDAHVANTEENQQSKTGDLVQVSLRPAERSSTSVEPLTARTRALSQGRISSLLMRCNSSFSTPVDLIHPNSQETQSHYITF